MARGHRDNRPPGHPEEAKTALQREHDRTAELRRQLATASGASTLQAELRTLAAGNPVALALDRLEIEPGQGTQPGS